MELKLDMSSYLPLREVVFRALRDAIVHGEFEPGERLLEVTLANKLGVSRTPVREAIRMLELEGLVVVVPRRGVEVAKITEKDLCDALEIRMALEELAVGLACDRITEEGREKLQEVCVLFKEAVNSKQVPAIVESDEAFHDVIFEAANNSRLVNLAQNLREQVYRYRVEYVRDFDYHDKLVKEHEAITNVVLTGDKELAKQLIRQHIYDQEQTVIKNISQ